MSIKIKDKLNILKMIITLGFILSPATIIFGQTAILPSPAGDDALYNQMIAKIAKTEAIFADRKTNFENIRQQQAKAIKPDNKIICQSFTDWNLIFHDRLADYYSLKRAQSAGNFNAHRSKANALIAALSKNLKEDQSSLKQIAGTFNCQLSDKASDGSENFFLSVFIDDFDYFGSSASSGDKKQTDSQTLNDSFSQLTSEIKVKEAEDLIAQGYFDEALKKLDAIIKAEPKNAAAYTQRAIALINRFQADPAIADASMAISLDPHNALAFLARSEAFFGQKNQASGLADRQTAFDLADQAINQKTKDRQAYFVRGKILSHDEKFDAAIADFTKAIEIDPAYTEAYVRRSLCYGNQYKWYEALADAHKMLQMFPQSITAHLSRGVIYRQLGELDKSIADLRRAAELDPANQEVKEILSAYTKPETSGELTHRYAFFVKIMINAQESFVQRYEEYAKEVKIQTDKQIICQSLKEVNDLFQNEKTVFEKIKFASLHPEITDFAEAIAANKKLVEFNLQTQATINEQSTRYGCGLQIEK